MKKLFALFTLAMLMPAFSFGQQKYALVIGNSNYSGSPLKNPVNDANDMGALLKGLSFNVEIVLNGTLEQMEAAVQRLEQRLMSSRGSHGFFFYAGHGKQSGGANYLIPVQAKDFSDEIVLRNNAMSLNTVMQRLDRAGNELNLIVLDACRDNPFTRERSGARGLSTVTHSPVGSMIMYATGPDSWADDGDGRNGLFTGHLIKNLKTPRISLQDVLTRTGLGVINETDKKNKKQVPQLYDQFFKAGSIFWNGVPSGPGPVPPPKSDPAPKPKPEPKPTPAPVPVPEVPEPLPPARSVCPRSGIEYQVGVSNDNREVIIRFYRPEGIKFPSNGVWTMEWSLEGSANVQNPKGSTKINKNDSVTHIYEAKLKVINPNAMVQLGTIKVVALSFTID